MGVPKFFSQWLAKKLRMMHAQGVNTQLPKDGICSLSFDVNGVIHKARAIVYGLEEDTIPEYREMLAIMNSKVKERRVMATACKIIAETTMTIKPNKTVYISVDGPVNRAKMQQQRGRRYASASNEHADQPDTSSITPGTLFMQKFHVYFTKWVEANRGYFPEELIYSSHLVNGEGEHKIMQAYRTGKVIGNGYHVLYGLDADLIMLSLLSPLQNIMLVREDLQKVININALKEFLIGLAPEKLKETMIPDFVMLMELIGNDFLPHSHLHDSMFERVEAILRAYFQQGKPATIKQETNRLRYIDFSVLPIIINALGNADVQASSNEAIEQFTHPELFHPSRFYREAIVSEPVKGSTHLRRTFDWSNFRSSWYNNEFYTLSRSGTHSIPGIPSDIGATQNNITEMCMLFVEGMAWVFRYYQTLNVDNYWVYPYVHCPLMKDLAVVVAGLVPNHGFELNTRFAVPNTYRHGALEQLLMVIPESNRKHNIPHALNKTYENSIHNALIYMHPSGFVLETDGLRKDIKADNPDRIPAQRGEMFLAVPRLPSANLEDAIEYIREIRKIESVNKSLERYNPQDVVSFGYSQENGVLYETLSTMMHDKFFREMDNLSRSFQRFQRNTYRGRGRGERGRGMSERGRGEMERGRGRGSERGRGGRERGSERGRGEMERGRGRGSERGRGERGRGMSESVWYGPHRGESTDISTISVYQIQPMKLHGVIKGPFTLIQDSNLKFGTKMRMLSYFTHLKQNGYTEVVTYGTTHGYGQAAVAWCCRQAGLKCILYINMNLVGGGDYRPTHMTQDAKALGAIVHEIKSVGKPTQLWQLKEKMETYKSDDPKAKVARLPLGLYSNETIQALVGNISLIAHTQNIHPKRIWVACGSGTVAKAISLAFPEARMLLVKVGKQPEERVLEGMNYKMFEYPGAFKEPATEMPPYASLRTYDAKVWYFVSREGEPGDFIWNIK